MRRDLSPGYLATAFAGLAATATVALASPATQPEDYGQDVPGTIVYSRDVPYRSAIDAGFPGKPERIDTSPDDLVIDSITLGLRPLSDSEAAFVSAPLGESSAELGGRIDAHLSAAVSPLGESSFSPERFSSGSGLGGAIGRSLGAIPTAMGALRNALGTGQ